MSYVKDPDIIFCFDSFVCLLVLVMPFWKWLLCSQCWFQRWYYDCCGYDGYVVVHDNAFVAVLHAFLCHVGLPRPVKRVCLQIFVLWWRFCLFAGAVCFSHSMFLVVSRLVFVAMYMLLALPRMFKWWGFRDEVCFWLCVTCLLVAILHTTFVLWRQCFTCPACFCVICGFGNVVLWQCWMWLTYSKVCGLDGHVLLSLRSYVFSVAFLMRNVA